MASAGIEVEFVDAPSGRTLVRVTDAADAVPRFTVGARITLGDAIREIVEVVPPDHAAWAQAGRVLVKTKRVGDAPFVDRGRRYTLPSISEELPKLVVREGVDRERLLDLHEDDWRQIEAFGAAAKSKVKQQLRAIDEVRHRFRDEKGFMRMQVREVPAPLEHVNVTVEALEEVLPAAAEKLAGISLHGQVGVVEDGVAWALPTGGVLYALAKDGRIGVLGYRRAQLRGGEADDAMILGAVLTRFGLTLVDWCGPWVVKGDRAELEKWLGLPTA